MGTRRPLLEKSSQLSVYCTPVCEVHLGYAVTESGLGQMRPAHTHAMRTQSVYNLMLL